MLMPVDAFNQIDVFVFVVWTGRVLALVWYQAVVVPADLQKQAQAPPAPVPWYGPEILDGLARLRHNAAFTENFSATTLRRSGAENTLLQSCMYSRLTCARKHIKPCCPESCKWVALGWVSLQADVPTKVRFRSAHQKPKTQKPETQKPLTQTTWTPKS